MDPAQSKALEWAMDKGGAYVVILLILFFYRRDWARLESQLRDQLSVLTELVIGATKAQADTAAALRENNVVVHQAKRVLETLVPERRDQR
jgi:hypothetical protein